MLSFQMKRTYTKEKLFYQTWKKSNTHKKWWESISKLFFMRKSKLQPKNLVKILFFEKKNVARQNRLDTFYSTFFFRLKVHEYVYQGKAFPLIFFLASIQRLHCHLWFYLESVIPFKSIDNEKISDSIHLIFGYLFWLCLRHVRNGKCLGWMTF